MAYFAQRKNIGPLRIYLEDIESILDRFSGSSDKLFLIVAAKRNDYDLHRFDSIGDLVNARMNKITFLSFLLKDGTTLRVTTYDGRIEIRRAVYSETDNFGRSQSESAYQIKFAEICKYLERRSYTKVAVILSTIITGGFILGGISGLVWTTAIIANISDGSLSPLNVSKIVYGGFYIALIFYTMLLVVSAFGLSVWFRKCYWVVITMYRSEVSFWGRNGDKILLAVISSAIGALIAWLFAIYLPYCKP